MQEGTGPQPNLINLNETDLYLEEPWQDLRGLDVYDTNNDQIGSVEDVYVDREQREAQGGPTTRRLRLLWLYLPNVKANCFHILGWAKNGNRRGKPDNLLTFEVAEQPCR